jgi:hypothetical protein
MASWFAHDGVAFILAAVRFAISALILSGFAFAHRRYSARQCSLLASRHFFQ